MSQATALLADAESSISSGAWDQAIQQLESIKQNEPHEPDVYRKLAYVQAIRGKFRSVIATYIELIGVLVDSDQLADAESVIAKVLSLQPESEEAREKRIQIEKKRGHTDRAVYLARELARLCIEQGDGDRSIRLLQEAQKEQPENLDISLELAEMFVSHGQIQDGANQYRRVANAFQEAGSIAKAAEAYRRMKVVQSDDPTVLLTLGRLYTELGKLDEAEQEFRSVLRHDLEHQDALMELGLVCQLKGRFRSGLLAFNKVLQNNPRLGRAMRKLGELNLSMGKQSEAVQYFLEAAQAYLEVEERDQAIEVFQMVLGVEEGNAQAQQGLTNLGAPLVAKEFEPPLPPVPPEDEAPTPEPSPLSARESIPEPPPGSRSKMEERASPPPPSKSPSAGARSSSPGSAKGPRKGLVSGGLLRKGLVDPSGGGKPMLGGKPTLGGGGVGRAGLRRPGLGMKDGGQDKPMLGMGGGGAKPTLGRRSAPEPPAESEQVFQAEEEDFSFGGHSEEPMESMFDSAPESTDTGLENDFEASANGLFENEMESPFGEGLGDSLFAPEEAESSPRPSAPVIGAFSSEESGDSGGASDDFLPSFSKSASAEESEGSEDDIFGFGGAESLFDEPDSSSGGLFDDESLPETQLFDEDIKSVGSALFEDDGAPESGSVSPEAAGGDLFGDEQFDNLFDEPDGGDHLASSDTIGSLKSSDSGSALFDEAKDVFPPASSSGDSSFDSLFSEVDDERGSAPVDDLFGDDLASSSTEMPTVEPKDGLYHEADESTDLFGEDLFPDASDLEKAAVPSATEDDLFSGADLFSEPVTPKSETSSTSLFDEPQAPMAPVGGGLFDEAPMADDSGSGLFDDEEADDGLFGDDDLFGQAPVKEAGDFAGDPSLDAGLEGEEKFDLFTEPLPAESQTAPSTETSDSAAGLFDGFESSAAANEDDFFGDAKSSVSGGLFDEEVVSDDDLFGEDGDDLFGTGGVAEVKPVESFQETSLDLGGRESGGGLFGEDSALADAETSEPLGDLFDIPDPTESSSLFDEVPEPEASPQSLFDEDLNLDGPGEGLFDSPSQSEPEAEQPAPLDLDLPMPNDPPLDFGSSEPETSATDDDLFSSAPPVDSGTGMDEHSLTIDKLRAEEMARVVDVEPVESSDSPEFMKLLEMTLPKAEEEPVEEAIPEDQPLMQEPETVAPQPESGLFDDPMLATDGGGLFDQGQEDIFALDPAPVDSIEGEGPDILGKPKVSLSIEDEAPTTDIELTDRLDASLEGSDIAAKIAAYRKALEETPNNLVMRTRLADIHLKYGMLEDALLQYRQVMRRNTESISLLHRVIQAEFWTENYAEAGESLLVLAKLHLKRGEHHDALDTLQSVLSLDSHHFEARKVLVSVFTSMDESKLAAHHLRQLAETALTKGEVDEAISAFGQLLEISNDPVFEERLAQIYESQGEMELALRSFQSLVVRYQEEERWEEAARVTERIVELNPELLDDRGALVDLYKKLGMTEKAMEQQFKLARLYQQKDQLPVAIRLYEGVLEGQAHNQEARRHLVDAYLDSGNVALALEQAEALTEHYLTSKDHQTAIELYDRLAQADPENVELQERLVKFYGLAGDLENAKVRWIGLADLHQARGRFVNAAEAIQRALDLDESQIELQNRLALLYAEQLNDQAAALTQLRKLFQLAPERLDAVKMYIDILLRQQQVSEAGQVLQQLEQAGGESVSIKNDVISSLRSKVEGNPTDLKARFNYGELCYHLGDLDHAIEQFQQTRRNPEFELMSYNMLGLCFAKKRGFNMLDLAIKQFKKGLETKVQSEQSHLELRYNLATIQYQNGRLRESLADFKECYRVDITYRDVRSWIEKIESELASSGS